MYWLLYKTFPSTKINVNVKRPAFVSPNHARVASEYIEAEELHFLTLLSGISTTLLWYVCFDVCLRQAPAASNWWHVLSSALWWCCWCCWRSTAPRCTHRHYLHDWAAHTCKTSRVYVTWLPVRLIIDVYTMDWFYQLTTHYTLTRRTPL